MSVEKKLRISSHWIGLNTTWSISLRVLFKIHCDRWQVSWPEDGETGKQEDIIISMETPQWCAGARAAQMHSNVSQTERSILSFVEMYIWLYPAVSKETARYIVLPIAACSISNYLVFSSDFHLCFVKRSAWCLMPPTVASFIVLFISDWRQANTYRGVIRHSNILFFTSTLHAGA